MKQILSGNDWIVSHFLPDEVSAVFDYIPQLARGELYGGSFIPATVPGDVQSDALDAGLIEDINYGYNARAAEWTYNRDWAYNKRFTPRSEDCRRVMLCFDGVDYACEVYLNGKWLGNHEIPWIPFEFDVTDMLNYGEENSVQVIVKAAPHGECQWGATSDVRNLKPRFAYGWDWCTRLVPLGIWKDVYLRYDKAANIEDLHTTTVVDYENKCAKISAELTMAGKEDGYSTEFTLTHPDRKAEKLSAEVTAGKAKVEFSVDNAELWWPNGMGDQPLYNVEATIGDNWDSASHRVGLYHITWTRTEGAGEDAMEYQPYVNGRRMYIQGYNWTPLRQLYCRPHTEAYEKRLAIAKASGANILRVWGAGLLERETFYNLCDEYGIIVMQELFQSSASKNNHPPRDEEYIDMLTKTARSAIVQKRNHPSLAIWCGGNELCMRGDYMDTKGNILIEGVEGKEGYPYDVGELDWVPLDAEYPTLVALREVVEELDPGKKWLHTSGSGPFVQNANMDFLGGKMHDVHGPWDILPPDEFYYMYNTLDMMLHAEFGCYSSASILALEKFVPEKFLWPLDENNPMANYHGRMFVGGKTRLIPYFGEVGDYKTYSTACRFMQWEQLRYSLEAHRRMDKRCAGAILWHFAEPWPNVNDNCTVDAYDQVKPAFYGEKAAFSPIHIAAKYDGVTHKGSFNAQFTLYNATTATVSGKITAEMFDLSGKKLAEKSASCSAGADSIVANALEVEFNNLPDGVFFIRQTLTDEGGKVLDQGYSIHSTKDVPYRDLLDQPECAIKAELCGDVLRIKNAGNVVASAVTVECDLESHVIFSDGCMMLLPGEEREIKLTYSTEFNSLYICGFGVPHQKLDI